MFAAGARGHARAGTSKKLVNFMLPTYKVGTEDKQGALHLLAITSESIW